MTKLEQTEKTIDILYQQPKELPVGTYEKLVCSHLGTIVSMLADIAVSLAIITDKERQNDQE